jgi:hypothetical protein
VKTNPPGPIDFASNRLKGLAPRGIEKQHLRLHDGISVYASRSQTEETARRFPALGSYIAELQLPDHGEFEAEPTLRPGHYTLWGQPDLLTEFVVTIVLINV